MDTVGSSEAVLEVNRPRLAALVAFTLTKALAALALLGGFFLYCAPLHPWSYLVFSDATAGALLAFIARLLRPRRAAKPRPLPPTLAQSMKWPLVVAGSGLQMYLTFCFGGNRWVG